MLTFEPNTAWTSQPALPVVEFYANIRANGATHRGRLCFSKVRRIVLPWSRRIRNGTRRSNPIMLVAAALLDAVQSKLAPLNMLTVALAMPLVARTFIIDAWCRAGARTAVYRDPQAV